MIEPLLKKIESGTAVVGVIGLGYVGLPLVREFTRKHRITLVNSVNPHRLEGQKTAAFEIVDVLGDGISSVTISQASGKS